MRISKTILGWGFVVLAILSAAATLGYRSIRKTCCTEELSNDQLRHLLRNAEDGNVAAMKRLFFFYAEGEDPVNEKLWLERAAAAGDAQAEEFMYDELFASKDVKQRERAVKYLIRAAEHGSPTAQLVLGESYRDGSGVPKNIAHARYCLRKSALSVNIASILASCDLALMQGNRNECEECLKLHAIGLVSLDRHSHVAKKLIGQRERITRKLNDLSRDSQ